jgi:tetratricopeptide (TPR) repeat protein
MLAAAIAAHTAPPSFADPFEEDPQAVVSDHNYTTGKQAIERKNWQRAAWHFDLAALRYPDNADVHNYLGYAYRQLGKLDLAFKHYKRALKLNPRHRGAHEYIGEAYLMAGDLAGAQKHLAALREICLLPCEELADLEREIKEYRANSRATGSR